MSHRLPIPRSLAFQALTTGARFRDRISVRVRATPDAIFTALRELMPAAMPGTQTLLDNAPREIVTGSAGRYHQWRDRALLRFESRRAFEAFSDPDYEKLFISVRVAPTGRRGEYWLVLEQATRALSPSAARRFRPYWWVVGPFGAFLSWLRLLAVRRRATALDRRST